MTDWEKIVEEHGSDVWMTIYRILDHSTDAADCYQETFLSAVKMAGRESIRNWRSVLKSIATRRAIDRLREQARVRRRFQQFDSLVNIVSDMPGPAAVFDEAALMERVRGGLAEIPSKQAEVFWLRNIEDLSYREIVEQLAIEINEVGVLLHRARSRLQQMFQSEEMERGHQDE